MARSTIIQVSSTRRQLEALAVPTMFGAFAAGLFGLVHLLVGEPPIDLVVTALALLPAAPIFARAGGR